MIRFLFLLLGALWLTGCDSQDEPARTTWPTPTPAIWHVTAPDGGEGWLFGTVHALPSGAEWRTPALEQMLAQTGVLVVEIANLADRDQAQASFAALSHTPGLPPLSSRVPAADRPALAALMDRAGMHDGDFAGVESWAASLMLSSAIRTNDPANGVDRALLDWANQTSKPITGLESFADQYGRFDTLSNAAQLTLLTGIAKEAQTDAQDSRTIAWLTGDLAVLERASLSGYLEQPELRSALLVERNQAWIEPIAALMNEGKRPLVAVGAGHMVGADGIPALLAERGFTVERCNISAPQTSAECSPLWRAPRK